MTKQTEVETTKVFKANSLSQAVTKDKEVGVKKTIGFTAPLSTLYIKEGFNIRDIDTEQVASLVEAYKAGRKVPAITVKITDDGLQVIDGHHRYMSAVEAGIEDVNIDEFVGDEFEATAFMITSSQGRNLEPLERATAYQRMIDEGKTKMDIHVATGRSRSDIDRHLLLLEASTAVKKALKDGKVGLKAVVQELKRKDTTPADASRHIMKAVKAADGHTVTTSSLTKFNKLAGIKDEVSDEETKLAKAEKKVAEEVKDVIGDAPAGDEAVNADNWSAKDTESVMEILSGFEESWLVSVNPELAKLVNKWVS